MTQHFRVNSRNSRLKPFPFPSVVHHSPKTPSWRNTFRPSCFPDAKMRLVLRLSMWLLLFLVPCACKKQAAAGPGGAGGFPATQVVAVEARRQHVSETLSLVGTLAPNEMVEIKSEMDGTIAEINFKEGDRVEAGRLLIRLDDSKLAATVAEAEANFKLSLANNDRAKQLSVSGLATPQDLDNAAAQFQVMQAALDLKKRELKDARILAPFAGVDTSSTSTSVTATIRWIVPGVQWNVSPGFMTSVCSSITVPKSC